MVIPGKWAIIPDYGVIKEQTAIDYISGSKNAVDSVNIPARFFIGFVNSRLGISKFMGRKFWFGFSAIDGSYFILLGSGIGL